MADVKKAQDIHKSLGMPSTQPNAMAGMTLIALFRLTPYASWSDAQLRIQITNHDNLHYVMFYDEIRNWLFLVEAVTSHGLVSPTRVEELEAMLTECTAGRVYVSAFLDFSEFRKHMVNIVWETEVWLCDTPDHMIHYNGECFLCPRR